MKKQTQLKEHGQALVVIAIAAVALFGFAALAIDGSMVFSDRRHAQNAADTAALDAALAKTRGGAWHSEVRAARRATVTTITGQQILCMSTVLQLMGSMWVILNMFRSRSHRSSAQDLRVSSAFQK